MPARAEKFLIPLEVEWNLTWNCNLTCSYCSTGYKSRGLWADPAVAEDIILLQPLTVTLCGGEPLLHPMIRQITERFHQSGLPVSLTTNGTLLNCRTLSDGIIRGLNWSRVSAHVLDGSHRQKKKENLLRNLRDYAQLNERLSVFFLITEEKLSLDEIRPLIDLVLDQGVQHLEFGFENRLYDKLSVDSKLLARVETFMASLERNCWEEVTTLKLPSFEKNKRCMAGATSMSIGPDGTVGPCPFLPNLVIPLSKANIRQTWLAMKPTKKCHCP